MQRTVSEEVGHSNIRRSITETLLSDDVFVVKRVLIAVENTEFAN